MARSTILLILALFLAAVLVALTVHHDVKQVSDRHRLVRERIESEMPLDRSAMPAANARDVPRMIDVRLQRREHADDGRVYTEIVVADGSTFAFPPGEWTGEYDADCVRQAEYDRVEEALTSALEALVGVSDDREDLRGRILLLPPGTVEVPSGDVISVLKAFLEAGINDVAFDGATPPGSEANADDPR